MAVNIKIWGPSVWYTMHKIAFSLPHTENNLDADKKKQLIDFYKSLSNLLPCNHCRQHYKIMLKKHNITKNSVSGKKISKWGVKIHNIVNRSLNKAVMSYPIATSMYKNKRINHNKLQNYIKFILIKSNKFPLNSRKVNARTLIQTYPCLKCKNRMIKFLENNKLSNINNQKQMTEWSKKLFRISKKPC